MKRREFITLLGGAAAAWPLAARAQQAAKLPTIGFLGAATPSTTSPWISAFAQRLREFGWIEGRNIAIEYRWAEGRTERFAEIAAEFVRLKVDVIVTHSTAPVVAAKRATSVTPIVFANAGDPVANGLVASLARPGGNITGISFVSVALGGKHLGLLHELQLGAMRVGVLVDPNFPLTESLVSDVQAAASSIRKQIEVLEAPTGKTVCGHRQPFARFAD